MIILHAAAEEAAKSRSEKMRAFFAHPRSHDAEGRKEGRGKETKLGFNSSRQIVRQEGDEEVARGEVKIRRFRHGILKENIS